MVHAWLPQEPFYLEHWPAVPSPRYLVVRVLFCSLLAETLCNLIISILDSWQREFSWQGLIQSQYHWSRLLSLEVPIGRHETRVLRYKFWCEEIFTECPTLIFANGPSFTKNLKDLCLTKNLLLYANKYNIHVHVHRNPLIVLSSFNCRVVRVRFSRSLAMQILSKPWEKQCLSHC